CGPDHVWRSDLGLHGYDMHRRQRGPDYQPGRYVHGGIAGSVLAKPGSRGNAGHAHIPVQMAVRKCYEGAGSLFVVCWDHDSEYVIDHAEHELGCPKFAMEGEAKFSRKARKAIEKLEPQRSQRIRRGRKEI